MVVVYLCVCMGSGFGGRSPVTYYVRSLTVWVWYGASAMTIPLGSTQGAAGKTKLRVKQQNKVCSVRASVIAWLMLTHCFGFCTSNDPLGLDNFVWTCFVCLLPLTKRVSTYRRTSETSTFTRTSDGTRSRDIQISKSWVHEWMYSLLDVTGLYEQTVLASLLRGLLTDRYMWSDELGFKQCTKENTKPPSQEWIWVGTLHIVIWTRIVKIYWCIHRHTSVGSSLWSWWLFRSLTTTIPCSQHGSKLPWYYYYY